MSCFKVGDRVRLSDIGGKAFPAEWASFGHYVGTVETIYEGTILPVTVSWETGDGLYYYDYRHLSYAYTATLEDVL